jgi:hypothetical protein
MALEMMVCTLSSKCLLQIGVCYIDGTEIVEHLSFAADYRGLEIEYNSDDIASTATTPCRRAQLNPRNKFFLALYFFSENIPAHRYLKLKIGQRKVVLLSSHNSSRLTLCKRA